MCPACQGSPTKERKKVKQRSKAFPVDFVVSIGLVHYLNMLGWLFGTDRRELQEPPRVDLVDLLDFDIHIAVRDDSVAMNRFTVEDIVTNWMNEFFEEGLESFGDVYAQFDRVYLLERSNRNRNLRGLQTAATETPIVTWPFRGAAIFSRFSNQTSVPAEAVANVQQWGFATTAQSLGLALRNSDSVGLGASVLGVQAAVATYSQPNDSNNSLEIVIIVAIVVACLAFLLLVVAVVMAYKTDRRNRRAFMVSQQQQQQPNDTPKTRVDTTTSTSESPPMVVNETASHYAISEMNDSILGGQPNPACLYPESVISDDISTSLSQYYQSGMAMDPTDLNDAASMSSMDSYGYSLDGFGKKDTTIAPEIKVPANTTVADPIDKADGSALDDYGVGTVADDDYDLTESTTKPEIEKKDAPEDHGPKA